MEGEAQDLCSSWGLCADRHVAPEKPFYRKENIFSNLNLTDQPRQHWHLGYLAGQMTSSQWVQNG